MYPIRYEKKKFSSSWLFYVYRWTVFLYTIIEALKMNAPIMRNIRSYDKYIKGMEMMGSHCMTE